jgi:general secretion pathway protein D
MNLRAIDTGVGQSIDLRHVPQEGSGANPAAGTGANPGPVATPNAGAPARGPAPARPSFGTVPGQSAMAAAPAALKQLSASADANGQTAAAAVTSHLSSPQVAGGMNLMFTPLAGPVTKGSTFQLPIVLTGGTDISSVPMQIKYDPAQLSLVSVTTGDLLGRDGQAVALVHRDIPPGSITVNAARPPGAAGVNGAGVVCVLTFEAKAAGESEVAMTRAATVNSAQQQSPIQGARIGIQIK